MNYVIYSILNPVNRKVYVGLSNNLKRRLIEHKKHVKIGMQYPLYNSMRKYGVENFIIEILEQDLTSLENAEKREIFWINELNTFIGNKNSHGYNLTPGGHVASGMLGKYHSSETKIKIRQANLGRIKSKEEIEKNRISHSGKKYSDVTRQKHKEHSSGKKNGMYGKSVKDIWVEKYGRIKAEEMWNAKYKKTGDSLLVYNRNHPNEVISRLMKTNEKIKKR